VPVALWLSVGWPLPHAVPTVAELREGLSGSTVPDELFPRALAVLTWLAWLQFMACLLVEARSALAGRAAGRVPGAGWGAQQLASSLVAAAMLLLPGEGLSAVAFASPAAAPAPVVAAAHATTLRQATDRKSAPEAKATAGYVVKRHDTLWRIAERHLGDPLRWPEIFELNHGRHQPDGRELKEAHWIYPGWTLLMPPDAVGLPTRSGGPARTGAAPPRPARPTPPEAPTAPEAPEAPEAPPAPQAPLTPPPPAATTPPESSRPAGGQNGLEPPQGTAAAPREPADGLRGPRAAGLLAAGVLALLAVLRVVQQRRRRTGRRIAMPEGELLGVEAVLREEEAPDVAELVDLAMRAMAAGIRRDGIEPPEVLGVLIGPELLEVMLAGETPAAPEPFVLSYSRRRWGLPLDVPVQRLREAAGAAAFPVPTLVTLGTTDSELLLLNLEASGLVALGGDDTAARAVLASLAVELATCRWAELMDLVLVGFGAELERVERARVAGGVTELLPWLEHRAAEVADLLAEAEARSVLAGRVEGDSPDGWAPAVVLCAEPPTAEEAARLAALAAVPSRSPVVAVVAGGEVDGARLTLPIPAGRHERVQVPGLRLDVLPRRLDRGDYDAVAELLDTATRDDVPAEEPEPAEVPPEHAAEQPAPSQAPRQAAPSGTPRLHQLRLTGSGPAAEVEVDVEPAVQVRVLGGVEIGGTERVERGKSEELVVFLALHPEGVDADQLAEALWPGRPPARGTLNTTTAVARAYLGVTDDGGPRLPHARNGIYRLDPSVGVDWFRFQALAARADGSERLRRALELVRGRPFEAAKPRSYGWALLDEAPLMESTIVDVADRLAGMLLDAGDHAGAGWAARRGLLAAPYDERLYRRLMLAGDAEGGPSAVEGVMDELLLRLEGEGLEPYDTLHQETRALYERLLRNRPGRPSTNAG
jgi:DNA-binding SARP family transcriptional activator